MCSTSKSALPKQHTAILMYHLTASLCISVLNKLGNPNPNFATFQLPTLPRFPICQLLLLLAKLLETRFGIARSSMGGWTPNLIRSLWWETSQVRRTRDGLDLNGVCTSVPLDFLSTSEHTRTVLDCCAGLWGLLFTSSRTSGPGSQR